MSTLVGDGFVVKDVPIILLKLVPQPQGWECPRCGTNAGDEAPEFSGRDIPNQNVRFEIDIQDNIQGLSSWGW